MARLFNGDAYAVITTDSEQIVLDQAHGERRLAIKFNVKQTSDEHPNQGECTIYNLSEHTRNNITANGLTVDIYAGYESLKLIGHGTIQNVNNIKNGPDWETVIKFGDGQKPYQTAKFSKSFSAGFDLKSIISELAKSFELSSSDASQIAGKIESGLSLDGLSKDVLNELSKQVGFDWSIQDGVLQITDPGKPTDETAIVINAATGLLQHPEITERGVKVRVQLNPDIRPKKLIDVEAISARITSEKLKNMRNKSANGVYICDTVQFIGDNFGGGFETVVDAVRYG
jgi:hypothetical protein